ncbi:MAG: hypothetical protein ABFC67_09380 [Mizugakiibacter sp.]|uniref:hypothetical protein n=1 Tax=Mizugakiibacter sp. TaxID=1972610 RepID=UPI0031C12357|nr:hypothetical protein [Xanthomonadaceae bacterium]
MGSLHHGTIAAQDPRNLAPRVRALRWRSASGRGLRDLAIDLEDGSSIGLLDADVLAACAYRDDGGEDTDNVRALSERLGIRGSRDELCRTLHGLLRLAAEQAS